MSSVRSRQIHLLSTCVSTEAWPTSTSSWQTLEFPTLGAILRSSLHSTTQLMRPGVLRAATCKSCDWFLSYLAYLKAVKNSLIHCHWFATDTGQLSKWSQVAALIACRLPLPSLERQSRLKMAFFTWSLHASTSLWDNVWALFYYKAIFSKKLRRSEFSRLICARRHACMRLCQLLRHNWGALPSQDSVYSTCKSEGRKGGNTSHSTYAFSAPLTWIFEHRRWEHANYLYARRILAHAWEVICSLELGLQQWLIDYWLLPWHNLSFARGASRCIGKTWCNTQRMVGPCTGCRQLCMLRVILERFLPFAVDWRLHGRMHRRV